MSEDFKNLNLRARFWNKVAIAGEDECWPWLASCGVGGYGHFKVTMGFLDYRSVKAHRLSWQLTYGTIPEGLYVLHKCDNPPCVNPNHLFLGTAKDNALDKVAKGRAPWQT